MVIDVEPSDAGRGHLRNAGDLRELRFERLRHRRGHGVGAGAGQRCVDLDGREIDLRQRRHRQLRIGDDADEQDAHHQQRGGDRLPDEWCGDAAAMIRESCLCVGRCLFVRSKAAGSHCAASTSAPSVSRYWPAVTTRSPLARPLRTTRLRCAFSPTSMSCFSTLLSLPTTNAKEPVRPVLDRVVGYDQDIFSRVDQEACRDRKAGPQRIVLVLEGRLHADRAARLIDRVVDEGEMALRREFSCRPRTAR